MRGKMLGQSVGHLLHRVVDRIAPQRCRTAHHVAVHVTAGAERRGLDFVDPLDHFAKIRFENPVQLQGLPRRHPQRGIAHFVAEIQFGQHLRAAELAARDFSPHHHRVGLAPAVCAGAFRSSRLSCW